MDEFSGHNHSDQHIMSESHELFEDVDFRVHYHILQKYDIVVTLSWHIILEGRDFDDINLALWVFLDWDQMFITDKPLAIEYIFNRLTLDEKGV